MMPRLDGIEFDSNLSVARRFENPPWPSITKLALERISFLAKKNRVFPMKDWVNLYLPEHGYIVRWSAEDEVYLEADPQRIGERVSAKEMKRLVESVGVRVSHCEESPNDPFKAL